MRMLSKLLASAGAVATTVVLVAGTAGPALADPPSTPAVGDVVGVGSDTTQFLLDQLSNDYNASHATGARLWSWDAVPQGQTVTVKAGGVNNDCTIVRPTGSSAGIAALELNATVTGGTGNCIDFARSSRARGSSDPACNTGGICFVALAGDAVTWASRSTAAGGTNAPASLTLAQLKNIYLCNTKNWSKVGGANAPIHAFLPQTSSGTRSFFLTALGGGTAITPGSCVSDDNNTLIENEGNAPVLNDPSAIFPYSIADYIAQTQHSASCTNGSNCGYPAAPACTPGAGQNLFGCNVSGVEQIKQISGKAPTVVKNGKVVINGLFPIQFNRTVYDVVRFDGTTADHIPAYLEKFFASSTSATKGWACSTATAKTDITNYGFLFPPKTTINGPCGHVS
jgi:ABC-type phosphate transport system substrate-binding protein